MIFSQGPRLALSHLTPYSSTFSLVLFQWNSEELLRHVFFSMWKTTEFTEAEITFLSPRSESQPWNRTCHKCPVYVWDYLRPLIHVYVWTCVVNRDGWERVFLAYPILPAFVFGNKGTNITDWWVIFYLHGRDQIWNSVGFIHRQRRHTWHSVMRTCGSNQTAPQPGLFTEPQPAVTQSEISHCCRYNLCILFLKSWEAICGSFFLKSKLPCLICFPPKLELYHISFSLCGLRDNFFKAFHVFCRVRGSFWPACLLLQGPVWFFLVRESLQMDAFRTATKRGEVRKLSCLR